MIGRRSTISFSEIDVTAETDLFYIAPGDDKILAVYGLFLGQQSDEGEAQSEMLGYQVIRGFTTASSGGASVTPRPLDPGDSVGYTARRTDTTVATNGTTHDLHSDTFNVQAGEKLWLPEEAMWIVTQGQTSLVVRTSEPAADAIKMSGTLYVAEIG